MSWYQVPGTRTEVHGAAITPRSLRLADVDGSPALSEDGRIDREALRMMDGRTPLHEIARRLEEAKREMEERSKYDLIVVNDRIDRAVGELCDRLGLERKA